MLDAGHTAEHDSHCGWYPCRQLGKAVVSLRSNPIDRAQDNGDKSRLYVAIAKLKPMFRRVGELELAELSIEQIAAELKINVECDKKRRTKARAELRWLMTEGKCDAMTSQK